MRLQCTRVKAKYIQNCIIVCFKIRINKIHMQVLWSYLDRRKNDVLLIIKLIFVVKIELFVGYRGADELWYNLLSNNFRVLSAMWSRFSCK